MYTPARTFNQLVNTGDDPVKLYFLYVSADEAQAIPDAEFRQLLTNLYGDPPGET